MIRYDVAREVVLFLLIGFLLRAECSDGSSRCFDGRISNVTLDPAHMQSHLHVHKLEHVVTSNLLMFKRSYRHFDATNKNLFQDDFPLNWVQTLCPNTMEHFSKMPSFEYSDMSGHQPVLSTEGAMVFSCMLRAVDRVAQKVGCPWYLHAGSALGAFVHGGPIPWDDDVDVIFDSSCAHDFRLEMERFSVDDVKFSCRDSHDGFKITLDDERFPMTSAGWRFPFIDVFYFHKNESTGFVHEMTGIDRGTSAANFVNGSHPMFERHDLKWPADFFFNVRQYFYGGYFYWAPLGLAELRYKASHCVRGGYNHRLENRNGITGVHRIDCCELSDHFPFYLRKAEADGVIGEYLMIGEAVQHTTLINETTMHVMSSWYTNHDSKAPQADKPHDNFSDVVKCSPASGVCVTLPRRALDMSVSQRLWNTSVADRQKWKNSPVAPTAQELASLIPNLDVVEVDNSISRSCPFVHHGNFRVVEFNAERGTHWIDTVALFNSSQQLRHADVIIFNEVDIGMARSGNVHTVRLLAFALGMNYAFGIEFIELTNGVKAEQIATLNMTNQLGLHGNAILSRCPMFNATNMRGPVEPAYFSDKPTFKNANGYEKRLGQRAIILASSFHSSRSLAWSRDKTAMDYMVLGSVHKLARVMLSRVQAYINESFAATVLIGGDQFKSFCTGVGLSQFDTNGTATWRASCSTTGNGEGDIICGSANIMLQHRPAVLVPCYRNILLSDHAIIAADFNIGH
jgi:hypothetical protein